MGETKVIYHLDDQETPYLVKLPIPAERVTLLDLKNALKKPNYKFFFKSMDDDFGWAYRNVTLVFLALVHIFSGFTYNYSSSNAFSSCLDQGPTAMIQADIIYHSFVALDALVCEMSQNVLCVCVWVSVCARGVQQGWMLGPVQLSTASILRLDYSKIWLLAWRHDLGCSYSYVNGWRAQSEYHRRELFRTRTP